MKFENMTTALQEKVLDKYRFINTDFTEWCELVFDDFKEKLQELGYEDAELYYSGFNSQGDGACFDADINIEKMIQRFTNKGPNFASLLTNEGFDLHIEKSSMANHYSHEKTRYVEIEESFYCDSDTYKRVETFIINLKENVEEERLELCKELYNELESYYDNLIENDAVKNTIISNNYDFCEHGDIL